MLIDSTRYKAFIANPERYRLQYILDMVPKTMGPALQRGIAFHTFMEEWHNGCPDEKIVPHLKAKGCDEEAIRKGRVLAGAVRDQYPDAKVLMSEREFKYEIPGSTHAMVGRIDQIWEIDGEPVIVDFKGSKPLTGWSRSQKLNSWKSDVQVDFYLRGARTLGYEVRKFIALIVQETVPPTILEIPESRSEAQLTNTELYVHQACELIDLMVESFGIEDNWIHFPHWPCDGGTWCEHRHICSQRHEPGQFPPGFCKREEHIELIKGDSKC